MYARSDGMDANYVIYEGERDLACYYAFMIRNKINQYMRVLPTLVHSFCYERSSFKPFCLGNCILIHLAADVSQFQAFMATHVTECEKASPSRISVWQSDRSVGTGPRRTTAFHTHHNPFAVKLLAPWWGHFFCLYTLFFHDCVGW
jgi:hypothetical protein